MLAPRLPYGSVIIVMITAHLCILKHQDTPSPSFSSARERREKLVNGNVDTMSAPSDLLTTKLGGAPPLTVKSAAQSITRSGEFYDE